MVYLLKMVIFHSYVNVYQMVSRIGGSHLEGLDSIDSIFPKNGEPARWSRPDCCSSLQRAAPQIQVGL